MKRITENGGADLEAEDVAYLTAQHRRTMALIGGTSPWVNESIRHRPGHINANLTSGD